VSRAATIAVASAVSDKQQANSGEECILAAVCFSVVR
jgi:hypothetical protein